MLVPILACVDVTAAIEYCTQKLGFELPRSMPPNESGQTAFVRVKLGDAEILLVVTEDFVESSDLATIKARQGIG